MNKIIETGRVVKSILLISIINFQGEMFVILYSRLHEYKTFMISLFWDQNLIKYVYYYYHFTNVCPTMVLNPH